MENHYLCTMQMSKKINRFWNILRDTRGLRLITNKYVLVTIVFLIIYIFDHNGIMTLWKNNREIERQRAAIEQYRKNIASIEGRMKSLTSNKDSIEAFAREEYYYHKDNEDIFIVE